MTEQSTQYLLMAVLYGTCLAGLTVNVIILATKFRKWKILKSFQTCDKILSCLAISRILYFIIIVIRSSILQLFPWLLRNNIVKPALYVLTMFMFYSSNWMATILCVFYCVKIVTYNYKLFIFLRTRIPIMVPRLILASQLISLISSLPFGWYGFDLKPRNLSNGSTKDMTGYEDVIVPNFYNSLIIFAAGSFPPFIIFCVANFLLIHFLLIHTRRIRSNESHTQSPNLTSHFNALKSMSLFLLLKILFFICMSLLTSGRFFTYVFMLEISSILKDKCHEKLFPSN
ncbi:taste receptor type 2 member 40-like [Dendropsophus ebraccatus]|uniref:taste receptor type 2 member 40-like n=1 Tax=Dendropsophus ebraccatus TaxID=150705 RepID=UPI0038313C54